MATSSMVTMITSPTVVPIWEAYPEFFRGADELIAWLAARPALERRCVERAAAVRGSTA